MRMSASLKGAVMAVAVFCLGLVVKPGTGLAVTVGAGLAPARLAPDAAATAHVQESYGKLPLSFIQNNGQLDSKVKFYERSA